MKTRNYPLRKVLWSELMWEGNPHQLGNVSGNRTFLREKLECGHKVEVRNRPAKRRRCDACGLLLLRKPDVVGERP